MNIFQSIFRYQTSETKYREIAANETLKQKSVRFGVISIFQSLFLIVASCLCFLMPALGTDAGGKIWAIVIVAGAGLSALLLLISSLSNCVRQAKLNKKWATTASIVILCAAFVASAVIFIVNSVAVF